MAQRKSAPRKPKKNAKKSTTKKNTKKKATAKKPKLELNPNQSSLLKNLGKTFTASKAHRMTQQSLIDKGLAVTDKSGTKIKATAIGRKHAKKI